MITTSRPTLHYDCLHRRLLTLMHALMHGALVVAKMDMQRTERVTNY